MPPIMLPPAIMLPARDSRRGRFELMFIAMGLVPTKESWRLRPMAGSKGPVVMAVFLDSAKVYTESGRVKAAGSTRWSAKSLCKVKSKSSSEMSPSPSTLATVMSGAESPVGLSVDECDDACAAGL